MSEKEHAVSTQEQAIRLGFRAALRAAIARLGATAPNPAVGCALLNVQGKILSVGAHLRAGEPHAEVVALEAAFQAGVLEQAHYAVVTLEPCAHHGRTPPCSERLRQSAIKEIWIGARDPNPLAAGGGRILQQGEGTKRVFFLDEFPVYSEIMRDCQALLAPFTSSMLRQRPWISVKQALDRSGQMEPPSGQKTFTSLASLRFAHRLRRATDAIITGIGTVLRDDPSFTVRHVADHEGRKPRLLVVCTRQGHLPEAWVRAREADGFIVECCKALAMLPALLQNYAVTWAVIEAGPRLLSVVESSGLWDDWLTIQQAAPGRVDQAYIRLRQEQIQAGLWGQSPLALLRHYGEE